MARFYRYVLADDNGTAPCPQNGLLTLATCKPAIRRTARAGDLIAAFAPSPFPRDMLAYAARVLEVVEWSTYVSEHAYPRRNDAVYSFLPDGQVKRLRAGYHPTDHHMSQDLSGPVLIFDPAETWYFGENPQALPKHLEWCSIGGKGSGTGRGHRVDEVDLDAEDSLLTWLKRTYAPGFHGEPRGRSTRGC